MPAPRPLLAQLSTQAKAFCHYLRAAVIPVDLSVIPQFTDSSTPAHPPAALALALLLSAGAALLCLRRRLPLLGLAGAWWTACLLPTAVAPLNLLVNDHRPYLALAGGILALASLWAGGLPGDGPGRGARLVRPAVPAGLVILAALSWQRAGVWRTEVTLWRDAVRQGPAVAASHHNLGFALHQAGDLDSARHHYERAVALLPGYARPLNNLGVLYREAGDLERAAQLLRQAAQSDPRAAEPLNNLGLVYAGQGRLSEAIEAYRAALERDPQAAEVWLNLGLALRDTGRRDEAFHSLQRALELAPTLRQRTAPGAGLR